MSRFVELISSRHAPHFVVLTLVSVGFGGCSADTSTRFQDNPFASRETTGTVQQNSDRQNGYYQQNYSHQQQPPRELPQYRRPYATAPVVSAPLSYPTASTPTSGGGRGMASYTPPAAPIETTGSTAPRSVAAAAPGWHREGGTTIIVGTADTLEVISKRYNVPSSEILKANGYNGPRMLQPGQQLVIPRRTANAAPPALSGAPSTKVAAALPASVHIVKPGDTLMNLSRRHNIPPGQLAAANHIPVTTQLKIGTKINIPGGGKAVAAAAPQTVAEAPKPVAVAAAVPSAPVAASAGLPQAGPVPQARYGQEAPVSAFAGSSSNAAVNAMATGNAELAAWAASVDADSRSVNFGLGVYADPDNVAALAERFALLGAVTEEAVTANGRPATRLTLTHLKPGATLEDAQNLARELGLTDTILY